MGAAKIVGENKVAKAVDLSGPLTLESLSRLIDAKLAAQNVTTAAAVATVKQWEPSPQEFVYGQRAYDNAPVWKATTPPMIYWKTGSKPDNGDTIERKVK